MKMQIGAAMPGSQQPAANENLAPPQMGDNGGQPMDDADPAGEPVTPEEQAEYEAIVRNAAEIVYGTRGDGSTPIVLEMGAGNADEMAAQLFASVDPPLQDNPVDNAAAAIAFTALMVDASAEEAGKKLGDDTLYHAFINEIGPNIVADIEESTGAQYDEDTTAGALFRAVDLFRQTSHRIDQATLEQEFGEIQRADAEGRMGELMPSLQSAMQSQQKEAA